VELKPEKATGMKHGMAAMVILQLPTEPVVGGTEDCSVRLGGCSSNLAIQKQLVADELVKRWKEERKSMRKRGLEGLGFCLPRAH
jgi:hypothetical protein